MDEIPTEGNPASYAFELSGGALCLDFVNTLGNRAGPELLEEHLRTYGDVVEFARQAGAIEDPAAETLHRAAEARRQEAARVLDRAIGLREALHRIFDPLARRERPEETGLTGLNAELGRALAHVRISRRDDAYALGWDDLAAGVDSGSGPPGEARLDAPLWPVAHSAMEILLEADLSRVGECDSDTCGFLFLDTTKNRSRRWCDTRICGNRARVRRHRRRQAEA